MPSLYSGPGLVADALASAIGSIPAGLLGAEERIPDVIAKTQHSAFERQWQPMRMAQGQLALDTGNQALDQARAMGPLTIEELRQRIGLAASEEGRRAEDQGMKRQLFPSQLATSELHPQLTKEQIATSAQGRTLAQNQDTRAAQTQAMAAETHGWQARDKAREEALYRDMPQRVATFMAGPHPKAVKDALELFASSPKAQAAIIDHYVRNATHQFAPHQSDMTFMYDLFKNNPEQAQQFIKAWTDMHPRGSSYSNPAMMAYRDFKVAEGPLKSRLQALRAREAASWNDLLSLGKNPRTGKNYTKEEARAELNDVQAKYDKLAADYIAKGGNPNAPPAEGGGPAAGGFAPPPGFFNGVSP